jgi:hypothetical protein
MIAYSEQVAAMRCYYIWWCHYGNNSSDEFTEVAPDQITTNETPQFNSLV